MTPLFALLLAAATPPQQLDTVVLHASPAPTAYAVERLDAETLERAGVALDPAAALARVPGVLAANRGNYAQDLQLSSRGFGARAGFGVRGLRLIADGIPASMPDGQGQLGHWLLADAASLEVLRGPFSALYCSAGGGVIALHSRVPQQDGMRAGLTLGSFGLRQAQAGVDRVASPEQWLSLSAQATQMDGWRAHSQAERRLAQLRWQPAAGWLLTAQAQDQPADDPLGLSREQLDADPRQTTPQAAAFNTRKTARQTQLGLRWQGEFATAPAQIAAWWGQRQVVQWQAIPVATQALPSHPGGVIDLDRSFGGLDARVELAGLATVGIAVESQRDTRRGFLNHVGAAGAPQLGQTGALRRDELNTATRIEPYAEARWQPQPELELVAGLRASALRVRSQDRFLSNGDDSGSQRFKGLQPVAGLVWRPAPGQSARLSAGRALDAPTLTELAYRSSGSGLNSALRAQSSRQLEAGWEQRGSGHRLALTAFRADTADEIVVQASSGGRAVFGNAGSTRRSGLELSAEATLARDWRGQLALSQLHTRSLSGYRICSSTPCSQADRLVPAGTPLAGAPAALAFAELRWRAAPGLDAALDLQARAALPADDLGLARAPGHGLWGASLAGQIAPGWRWRLRLDNLLNRAHVASVIVNEANRRYFEPGPPRQWQLSLQWQPGL